MKKLLLLLLIPFFAKAQTFPDSTKQSGGISFTPQWNYTGSTSNQVVQGFNISNGKYFTLYSTKQANARFAPIATTDIYLAKYTDSYTGIDGTTHHNEGSALVQAYNSITDTSKRYVIHLDPNKIYFSTGFTGAYSWLKPNIELEGSKPTYSTDGKSLTGGSIVLGEFDFFANNLYFHDFGVDAGYNYCATYSFASGTDAFKPCWNYTGSLPTQRHNIFVDNVVALCKPNVAFHCILLEFANIAGISNSSTLYGQFGIVLKSENVFANNNFSYGADSQGMIIKADNTIPCNNISVNGFICDTLPKGVAFFVAVPHRTGLLINPGTATLSNVQILNVTINGYQDGLQMFGNYAMNGLQVDNFTANNCAISIDNELVSGSQINIGKVNFTGLGGANYGYVQSVGPIVTTFTDINMKNVVYGISAHAGSIFIQHITHDIGTATFDVDSVAHMYVGSTKLTNVTTRNTGTFNDEPLPLFHSVIAAFVINADSVLTNVAGFPKYVLGSVTGASSTFVKSSTAGAITAQNLGGSFPGLLRLNPSFGNGSVQYLDALVDGGNANLTLRTNSTDRLAFTVGQAAFNTPTSGSDPVNNADFVTKQFGVAHYAPISGGYVSSVATGNGLTGGTITSTGTLKADTAILQTILNFKPLGSTYWLSKTATVLPSSFLSSSLTSVGILSSLLTVSKNSGTLQAPPSDAVLQLANADGVQTRLLLDAYGTANTISFRASQGTAVSPSALTANQTIGGLGFLGYGASAYSGRRAGILGYAAENWSASVQGTYMGFETTAIGSTSLSEKMRLLGSGLLCVGCTVDPTSGNLLAVNGNFYNNGTINTNGNTITGKTESPGDNSTKMASTAYVDAATYPKNRANGYVTAKTNASDLTTYTVGASNAPFYISANILVTASTLHSFGVFCDYTDEGSTARTVTLNVSQLTGAFITSITNGTGASAYEGVPIHIRAKAATAIRIYTDGTFTSVTYNGGGLIVQEAAN